VCLKVSSGHIQTVDIQQSEGTDSVLVLSSVCVSEVAVTIVGVCLLSLNVLCHLVCVVWLC